MIEVSANVKENRAAQRRGMGDAQQGSDDVIVGAGPGAFRAAGQPANARFPRDLLGFCHRVHGRASTEEMRGCKGDLRLTLRGLGGAFASAANAKRG